MQIFWVAEGGNWRLSHKVQWRRASFLCKSSAHENRLHGINAEMETSHLVELRSLSWQFNEKANLLLFDKRFSHSGPQPEFSECSFRLPSPQYGAIWGMRRKTMCSMVRRIECEEEVRTTLWGMLLFMKETSASVVNELFFHLILKLESVECRTLSLWLPSVSHRSLSATLTEVNLQPQCCTQKKDISKLLYLLNAFTF